MDLKNRDLITIDDLTNSEIESIFSLSDEMSDKMPEQYGLCAGKVMATIFFEPSTRTRLSFESAMHRLGRQRHLRRRPEIDILRQRRKHRGHGQDYQLLRRYYRAAPPLGRRRAN